VTWLRSITTQDRAGPQPPPAVVANDANDAIVVTIGACGCRLKTSLVFVIPNTARALVSLLFAFTQIVIFSADLKRKRKNKKISESFS
jgi:hypothetical protein